MFPPAIIGNLIIVGGGVTDNVSTSVPGGVVRAYDIVTGDLVWYWDPIPPNQEPIIDEDGDQLYQGAQLMYGLLFLPILN